MKKLDNQSFNLLSFFIYSTKPNAKMKRFAKITLVLSILLGLAFALGIFYYFKKNDAPILHGELELNVEYKVGQSLDLYQPTNQVYEKTPVVIYIHGGAWITGSKSSVNNARFNVAFNELRKKGYAIVSPEYTLAAFGKTPFPTCLADAFDAVHWIENNAETYNFDLDNVGILGESAGSHIGMMVAYDKNQTFTSPNSIDMKYMVNVYGPVDLFQLYKAQIPLIDSIKHQVENFPEHLQEHLDITKYLFGFDPAEDTIKTAEFTQQYSPINFLNSEIPNTLIIHGIKDRVVPISQTHILKAKLESLGIMHEVHELEGVDHAFRDATEKQKANIQNWITEFITRHYIAE